MLKDFDESVTKKTDKELLEYLKNTDRYSPESLVLVIDELKLRGRKFSDEELRTMSSQTDEEEEIIGKEYAFRPFFTLKKNVVTDTNAPLFYSQLSIMAFSTFFSVILGSILFCLNIEGKLKKAVVLAYGFILTSFSLYVGNLAPYSSFYMILINAVGGCILTHAIWIKYIGNKTKYRAKPILIPVIISVLVTALSLFLMIS